MKTPPAHQFIVPENAGGKRLDVFLAEVAVLSLTRSRIAGLIKTRFVLIDGKPVCKPGVKLVPKQFIHVTLPSGKKLALHPIDLHLNILYEDDALAVIEKPSGISMHPSSTENEPTIVHGLLHALKNLSGVGGVERPGIVHRLDKGTSGVVIVSKTDQAHLHLSGQFKEHSIVRKYLALVCGNLSAKGRQGTFKTFFGRNPKHRKKMTSKWHDHTKLKSGRKAVTHWKILETYSKFNLVECELETGRTHQIRVHLSEAGAPVVCDPLYGDLSKQKAMVLAHFPRLVELLGGIKHQLLHAYYLEVTHPVSGERLKFESALPKDFSSILRLL